MYKNIPDSDYFSLPYISQSRLKLLTQLTYAQFLSIKDPEQSDAMRFGSAAHAINLGTSPIESFEVFEKPDGRTKVGKEMKASLESRRHWLYTYEKNSLMKMQENFNESPEASFLRDKAEFVEHAGIVEVANSRYSDRPVKMKFKPDLVHSNMIVDYKTIGVHVTPESIRASMRKGQYAFQLACYLYFDQLLTGKAKSDAAIIWQETIEPFGVYVMPLKPSTLAQGWAEFTKARDKLLEGVNRPELIQANHRGFIEDPSY